MNRKTLQQREANNKKWRQHHRAKARYLTHRTSARTFVRKYAHPEDMRTLHQIWEKRIRKK